MVVDACTCMCVCVCVCAALLTRLEVQDGVQGLSVVGDLLIQPRQVELVLYIVLIHLQPVSTHHTCIYYTVSVQCTVHIIDTIQSVQCTVHIIDTIQSVNIIDTVQSVQCTVHIIDTIQSVQCTVHIIYTIQSVQCTVHIIYTIQSQYTSSTHDIHYKSPLHVMSDTYPLVIPT